MNIIKNYYWTLTLANILGVFVLINSQCIKNKVQFITLNLYFVIYLILTVIKIRNERKTQS